MEQLSINAPVLIRELARNGGVTRQELQVALRVSGPTVTRTILELSSLGIAESFVTASGAKGRPAEIVDFAANGLCLIAVSVRAERVRTSLVDARGRLIETRDLALGENDDYIRAVGLIGQAILHIVGNAAARFRCLAGVGISFGGAADYETGAVTTPSAFQQWQGKPLARDLEFYTGLPCAIDNYSFALVGALNWFDASEHADFFLVVADYGIGGVLSINNHAYSEAGTPAGFGHVSSRRTGRLACHCGGYDCLSATSSVKALAYEARATGLVDSKIYDLAALVRNLDASQKEAALSLLASASGRIAESALTLCRGIGLMRCVFGGMLFDCSPTARAATKAVFTVPGHRVVPHFLQRLFDERSPDDLAAASIAYHLLSDTRQVLLLDACRIQESMRLRQQL